jgi:hypothetical protein
VDEREDERDADRNQEIPLAAGRELEHVLLEQEERRVQCQSDEPEQRRPGDLPLSAGSGDSRPDGFSTDSAFDAERLWFGARMLARVRTRAASRF